MCGFAGFFNPSVAGSTEDQAQQISAMVEPLVHRGPDGSGIWVDSCSGIALGHRRLSILELTAAGAQPFHSSDGRYVITFNGEIYNHLDLRRRLTQSGGRVLWRGHSDTETLVETIAHFGIESTLRETQGMFGFALWDKRERSLTLARDRMGEKPLYFGWQGHEGSQRVLLFGSELKALKAHRAFRNEIDRKVVRQYLQHGYVPAPASIYKGVRKLSPGTYATFRSDGEAEHIRYWSQPVPAGESECPRPLEEWVGELDSVLGAAVEKQMLSDVPLGAFLSGGIDSSTIVALMQKHTSHPVKTFTIGSENASLDEAHDALAVAKALGTEHASLIATDADARKIIPLLPQVYDEPFADSSQIPTILVSQLASRSVKVVLSGDGGDELFAGYERYHLAQKTFGLIAALPLPARKTIAKLLRADRTGRVAARLANMGRFRDGRKNLHDLIIRVAQLMDAPSAVAVNQRLGFRWQPYENPALPAEDCTTSEVVRARITDSFAEMTFDDLTGYLIDDILVKVDRAAMSQSIETRVPMLDPDVVALAARIPMQHKITPDGNKRVLREVLYRYVPKALVDRPKRGFAVPLHDWLRGPLRQWADDLLSPDRLAREGYFDPVAIDQVWREHRSGSANHQWKLWPVLMFQAWLDDQDVMPSAV